MIITGYPGIGKTTLAKQNMHVIDLESSNFWKYDAYGNKSRPDDWYVYYCQIAVDLSKQGYDVFIACHPQVRDYMSVHKEDQKFCIIYPGLLLKDEWVNKLEQRYKEESTYKNLSAWLRARDYYTEDISRLYTEERAGRYDRYYVIEHMDYDLNYIRSVYL